RPGPTAAVLHGSARPFELWRLMHKPAGPTSPQRDGGDGIASFWALLEEARWVVDVTAGHARGRIMLELRGEKVK
ncbi:MAG: hypothetical protein ACIAS6_09440, partial [Phycisphaerales bacterium JB060]